MMAADVPSIANRPIDMVFTAKVEYGNGLSYPRQTVISIDGRKQCVRWFDTGADKWSDWQYYNSTTGSGIKYLDIDFLKPVFSDLGGAGTVFTFDSPISDHPELVGKTLLSVSFYHWSSNIKGIFSVGFDRRFQGISILSTSPVTPDYIRVRVVYV